MSAMPKKIDLGRELQSSIYALLCNIKSTKEDPIHYNPMNRRTVMGYAVPAWQRPLVWSVDQKIKFIESIWIGMPLGSYTINYLPDSEVGELQNIIIDGQQRLMAIQDYINDGFEVFGSKWSDLDPVNVRRFGNIRFSSYEMESTDESFLRDTYNRMNFGGTAHTESERA